MYNIGVVKYFILAYLWSNQVKTSQRWFGNKFTIPGYEDKSKKADFFADFVADFTL